jgi:hypothetical protein
MHGFQKCSSWERFEVPASVEVISSNGFRGCKRLREVILAEVSRIRKVDDFKDCLFLNQIENYPTCWNFAGSKMFITYSNATMTLMGRILCLKDSILPSTILAT